MCVVVCFAVVTTNTYSIYTKWELRILIVTDYQMEYFPLLPEYKTLAAQQFVVTVV